MSENMGEVQTTNTEIIKKKSKTGLIIGTFAGVIAIIGIVMFLIIFVVGSDTRKANKKNELAEKYLTDLDYDNAILAYKEAIALNPKGEKAYIGISDAYEKKIDALSEEDYDAIISFLDEEIAILKKGVEETGSNELKELLEKAKNRKLQIEDKRTEELKKAEEEYNFSDASVGDIVLFGSYEQDGDESNGAEPIEWEILEIEGNRALLISKYVLDGYRVHSFGTWENCSLRKWLNNDFINTAFSADEQSQIPTVTLSNPDNNYYWEWECEGGNATQDQVFLLSMEEICKYYQFDSWDNENQSGFCQKLITDVTPYAINKGVACYTFTDSDYEVYYVPEGYTSDIVGKSGAIWWSRTPALNNEYFICVVCEDGFTGYSLEFDVALEKLPGIRPALYIEW